MFFFSVARSQIVRKMLLKDGLLSLSEKEIQAIAKETEGDCNFVIHIN